MKREVIEYIIIAESIKRRRVAKLTELEEIRLVHSSTILKQTKSVNPDCTKY